MLDALDQNLPDLFRVIDLTGVFLNGIIGGRLARQKRFDAVGFAVLAIMSALGGGMVRDTLLQAGPPVALTDPYYLVTALAGALIAFLWKLDSRLAGRMIVVADGIVLGTWAATGTVKTLSLGFGILPAIMLGMITAVGGGMIRDVSAGNVPMVFGGNNLYATPAAVASVVMVIFFFQDLQMLGMLAATIVGSSFTVVAHWRKWQLPTNADWTLTLTSSQLAQLLRNRGTGWRIHKKDLTESLAEQLRIDSETATRDLRVGTARNTDEDVPAASTGNHRPQEGEGEDVAAASTGNHRPQEGDTGTNTTVLDNPPYDEGESPKGV